MQNTEKGRKISNAAASTSRAVANTSKVVGKILFIGYFNSLCSKRIYWNSSKEGLFRKLKERFQAGGVHSINNRPKQLKKLRKH